MASFLPYETLNPVRKDFLVFSKPKFCDDEISEIISTLKSGWVGTGPKAHQFEKEFAQYTGSKYAVAVNSCTAALHLSCMVLDLKPGDEIIVPALTFGATANAVIHSGGIPVFVDVDPKTLCLDLDKVQEALTPKTRGVILVHFAGKMGPVRELAQLCQSKGIALIEDCAHAIETSVDNKHAGTFGQSGCFSFYATKNVSTAEGGMFVTQDEAIAARARKLSLHGMSKDAHRRFSESGYTHYDFDEVGFKYNMPDIAASLGLHQLKRVNVNYALRTTLWKTYVSGLKELPLQLPPLIDFSKDNEIHALHLFQIQVPASLRDFILSAYGKEKIGVGVHYQALTDLNLYQKFLKHKNYPVASAFGLKTISLPLGTAMTVDDVKDVVRATEKILNFYEIK